MAPCCQGLFFAFLLLLLLSREGNGFGSGWSVPRRSCPLTAKTKLQRSQHVVTCQNRLAHHAIARKRSDLFQSSSGLTDSPIVTTQLSLNDPSRWDSFDYERQWYPMVWLRDLPVGIPTQVTLFDVNYVVVRHDENAPNNTTITVMLDRCPHKQAALSEGRLTETGYLQCAYHGWSFSSDGSCVNIPQAASPSSFSQRTACAATSVPVCVHQELVWLWPGPQAPSADEVPPTIPELDDPAFQTVQSVRDFPMIDISLLVNNIMDADHGLFAHQAVNFDMYSADASKNAKQQLEEKFADNKWNFRVSVPAVKKVLLRDRERRQARGEKLKSQKKEGEPPLLATYEFMAPSTIAICRRNATTLDTNFVTAFWVCPTGVGKTRFLSVAAGKNLPFRFPRWLQHLFLNGFLDQDTILVASQQPPVLHREAQELRKQEQPIGENTHLSVRSALFSYQSPSDKSLALLDRFWDATLARAPNRASRLVSGNWDRSLPPRSVLLDRSQQHTAICPDSQGAVRRCQSLQRFSRITLVGCFLAAAWRARTLLAEQPTAASQRALAAALGWLAIPSFAALMVHRIAGSIVRRFSYCYTDEKNRKNLARIPKKIWMDPE